MNDKALELFLAACGSEEPIRFSVEQRNAMDHWVGVFAQPFLVIGRRPESDLILNHWQVSKRHAYLQLIEGRYYCIDLGSRTGTHGGDATRRSGWLERGRSIQVGPYTVKPEWPTTETRPNRRPPGVTLELPSRAIGQATWRMDRYLAMIGQSPACKIRVLEPDVSMFHCSLVLTIHGLWAIDLLGQDGIYINGEKVRCGRVDDGDELRIGRHIFRARYDQSYLPLPMSGPLRDNARAMSEGLPEILPSIPFPSSSSTRVELPATMQRPQLMTVGTDMARLLEQAGGAIDPSVNLLVHQFGMMQQNMLDQFHNTMMMMFDGFATLHREQAATIREEFEQVRKLSTEIEALRVETARLAKEAAARPAAAADSRPRLPGNGHANPYVNKPLPKLPGDSTRRPASPAPEAEIDIHAQLCQKLASIETERQNRWQKILGMMSKS